MLLLLLICIVTVHRSPLCTLQGRMFRSEPLPAAVLQQLSATREATRTLHDFESAGDTQEEMQARHAWAMDTCIVSLGAAIRALREHALSGLEDLVGPALGMVIDTSEDEAPPCKRRRTRSDEESGEDRSLDDDEPDNDIPDAALAHDGGCGAPESGDDEPWDPFEEVELQRARDAGFSRGCSS